MVSKKDDFSHPDPMQLLRSPQAQRLLAQLQQLDPKILQQAADLAARGEADRARELLRPGLDPEEVQRLAGEMRESHG